MPHAKPDYLPTPDEIAAATQAIRRTWDDREEQVRRVGTNRRIAWSVPGAERGEAVVSRRRDE